MGSKILLESVNNAVNSVNFPALKYAFEYDGCDFDTNTITCPISGLVLTFSDLDTNGTNGFSVGATAPTLSKNMVAPETKGLVLVAIANSILNSGQSWEMGSPLTTQGAGCSSAQGFMLSTIDASNYHQYTNNSFPANSIADDFCHVLAADFPNDYSIRATYVVDAIGSEVVEAVGTSVGTGGITLGLSQIFLDANQRIVMPTGVGNSIVGFYIFHFENGTPLDVSSSAAWMGINKTLYPGWIGKT